MELLVLDGCGGLGIEAGRELLGGCLLVDSQELLLLGGRHGLVLLLGLRNDHLAAALETVEVGGHRRVTVHQHLALLLGQNDLRSEHHASTLAIGTGVTWDKFAPHGVTAHHRLLIGRPGRVR